jgi:predicted RecA/RadA family phage recombinase
MYTYDQPFLAAYTVNAAALDTAGEILNVAGPDGYVGRVVDIAVNVTTGVTVAASNLQLGSAGDADAYATLEVPITAADGVVNGATVLTTDDNVIPDGGPVVLTCGGEATAGDGTVTVFIAWYQAGPVAS